MFQNDFPPNYTFHMCYLYYLRDISATQQVAILHFLYCKQCSSAQLSTHFWFCPVTFSCHLHDSDGSQMQRDWATFFAQLVVAVSLDFERFWLNLQLWVCILNNEHGEEQVPQPTHQWTLASVSPPGHLTFCAKVQSLGNRPKVALLSFNNSIWHNVQ